MLITTPIQSAKNLLLDMADDAEVGSGTSSTTRSVKQLSASVDMMEDAEFCEGNSGDDEIVKRLPFKKSSRSTGYFISLHSEKRWVSLNSFSYDWSS